MESVVWILQQSKKLSQKYVSGSLIEKKAPLDYPKILDYQNICLKNHLMNLWPLQSRYEEAEFWKMTAKGV